MNGTLVYPANIQIGPLALTGFGLAVLLAFTISQIISQRELERRGQQKAADTVPDLIFAAVLGTLIGAKLYYVLIITRDWHDLFSRSGFVFWGGFIGSVLLCWATIAWRKLSFARIADVAGIAIAAGYSVGRTGCWAVGDDYGHPATGPLAVAFPQGAPQTIAGVMNRAFGTPIPPGSSADTLLYVHPTQLYEVVLGFVMFLILWKLRDHDHAEGWLFGMYCVLAGTERFIIEFFRAKDDRFFGPLTAAQVIGLAIAAVGVAVMAARRNTGPGRPGIHAGAAAPA